MADQQWEVLRVLDERRGAGVTEFFVKWKDGPEEKWPEEKWSLDKHDSWEPEDNLKDCPELIREFRENRGLATPSKKDKRRDKKKRKPRAYIASDEEEEEAKNRAEKKERKKRTIDSSDEQEEETRESSDSASRRKQRDKKRTGCGETMKSQGFSTSACSRRPSEEIPSSSKAFLAPSTPTTLKTAKTEPQSAVTNDTELNKFKGRHGEKIAPGRRKAYNKAEKLERLKTKKTKSRSRRQQARLTDAPRPYDDGEEVEEPLFNSSQLKTPKGEIVGDSNGEEERPTFDDLEDKEEKSSEYEESDDEVADDENRPEGRGEGRAQASVEENGTGTPRDDERTDGGLVMDEGGEGGDQPDNEEHSSEDDDSDLGNQDDPVDAPNEFNIDYNPQDPMGYDLGMEGRIIDYQVFGFDNGAEDTFCCVHFPGLNTNQWIRRDMVKERDPHGFDSFVRDLYEEEERKAIHRGAKEYRAERRRMDRLERGEAEE